VASCVDLRQVAEIEQAAAQEFRRLGLAHARAGKQAGRDVAPFALEQGAHVGRHFGAAGRRTHRRVRPGQRLEEPAASGVVTSVPGDPSRLARRVGPSIERRNHLTPAHKAQ
jgi:hypothetical protein